MKITREFIEFVAPRHDRTSCSDETLLNEFYQIHETKLREVVVSRTLEGPRCLRCFLLDHQDQDMPEHLELEAHLRVRQPKFKITQEEG
jgi:hypothetical protein